MSFPQAHLALYCLANNQISTSLKLMYRARYLALICHGENHPEVGLFDVSNLLYDTLYHCMETNVTMAHQLRV